jgi:hypothetical protein
MKREPPTERPGALRVAPVMRRLHPPRRSQGLLSDPAPLSAGGSGSRSRGQPSSKNETPKSGLGDQGPEWHFCSPIPDTETARYLRNAAVPRGFEGPGHVERWRPDWLAGAAGNLRISHLPELFRPNFP